ncbi:MAG: hypothetical protein AAGF67_06395 [Verrucomicrobiota bacterium]
MIRIPFSSDSESPQPEDNNGKRMSSNSIRGDRGSLEKRMGKLEEKLDDHAQDLKDQVTERVERIESRIQRAMNSLSGETEGEDAGNVIEFASEAKAMHHLPAASAISALNELNSTLKQTRKHLEALRVSVDQMRREVPHPESKSA